MKKIFLFAAMALAAGSMSADVLTFYVGEDHTPVEPGTTVSVKSLIIDKDYGDEGMDYTLNPHLYLGSDVAASNIVMSVKGTNNEDFQLCAGGSCEMATSYNNYTITKTGITIGAGEMIDTQFDKIGFTNSSSEIVPTIEADIYAQYGSDESTRKAFHIILEPEVSAVTIIETDSNFLSFEGGIRYALDGNATVALYDLGGKCVLSRNVSGEGVISTDGLARGIYAYSISGSVKKAGKIYVK